MSVEIEVVDPDGRVLGPEERAAWLAAHQEEVAEGLRQIGCEEEE